MGTGETPSYIKGTKGSFTLSEAATLGITDPYGITKSSTSSVGGNIKTKVFEPSVNRQIMSITDQAVRLQETVCRQL